MKWGNTILIIVCLFIIPFPLWTQVLYTHSMYTLWVQNAFVLWLHIFSILKKEKVKHVKAAQQHHLLQKCDANCQIWIWYKQKSKLKTFLHSNMTVWASVLEYNTYWYNISVATVIVCASILQSLWCCD